jgi:hypothetical protein
MNFIDQLSEFYKHCLNISSNQRPNNNISPLSSGWMRCYITPYLINNKVQNVISPSKFKNSLIFTIKDYNEYIQCIVNGYDENVIEKTSNLIYYLENVDENNIISLIENNYSKFPSYSDCDNEDIIEETYNNKFNTNLLAEDELTDYSSDHDNNNLNEILP